MGPSFYGKRVPAAAISEGLGLLPVSTHIPSRQDPYHKPTEPTSQHTQPRVFFRPNQRGAERM